MQNRQKQKESGGNVGKFGLAGFMRVAIAEDGKLVADSGLVHNVVTDYGLDEGLGQRLLGGSPYGLYVALGTGGITATSHTILTNEITHVSTQRDQASTSSATSASAAGVTARWYGTLSSSESRFSASTTIGNIGVYASSATNSSTLLCGATYSSSGLNTNQDVNYTYEWQFVTTT